MHDQRGPTQIWKVQLSSRASRFCDPCRDVLCQMSWVRMCRFTDWMHVSAGSPACCWTCMVDNRCLNQTADNRMNAVSCVWMWFDWEHSFGCSPQIGRLPPQFDQTCHEINHSFILSSQIVLYGDCTAFPISKSTACPHSNRELQLFITPLFSNAKCF